MPTLVYESLDPLGPTPPPRSRLYSLEALGLRTATFLKRLTLRSDLEHSTLLVFHVLFPPPAPYFERFAHGV
jgi:hypothetical protein